MLRPKKHDVMWQRHLLLANSYMPHDRHVSRVRCFIDMRRLRGMDTMPEATWRGGGGLLKKVLAPTAGFLESILQRIRGVRRSGRCG